MKKAIIVGASSGIGKGIALSLLRDHYKIGITGRRINNLEEIKKRMKGWQLESFEESYSYKTKNGISLFKKQKFDEQK